MPIILKFFFIGFYFPGPQFYIGAVCLFFGEIPFVHLFLPVFGHIYPFSPLFLLLIQEPCPISALTVYIYTISAFNDDSTLDSVSVNISLIWDRLAWATSGLESSTNSGGAPPFLFWSPLCVLALPWEFYPPHFLSV